MIKNKLLLMAILATGILVPVGVQAQGISIEIGDRPFYRHGPRYWAGDYEMIWVPGHRSHGRWIHGRYVRGERRHLRRHHRRHDNRRFDDRRFDDRRDREEIRREEFRESNRR